MGKTKTKAVPKPARKKTTPKRQTAAPRAELDAPAPAPALPAPAPPPPRAAPRKPPRQRHPQLIVRLPPDQLRRLQACARDADYHGGDQIPVTGVVRRSLNIYLALWQRESPQAAALLAAVEPPTIPDPIA